MAKTLIMTFITEKGTKASIALKDPKEGLTPLEINNAFYKIISKNIFFTKDGDLVGIDNVKISENNVRTIEL